MKITLIEPYMTGSHEQWAKNYQKYSSHYITILSLKGQFWKWRMHGGAVTLADQFFKNGETPDLILATDMLDLSVFLSLTRKITANIPVVLYFHENQLVYPWSPDDRDIQYNRDKHYGFINFTSALSADYVFFNSDYNRSTFLNELRPFLKHFPDYNNLEKIKGIREKSSVLPLGMDLIKFDQYKVSAENEVPIILWNHRWEYDKNPADFFTVLKSLKEKDYKFNLVILGENFSKNPIEFDEAREFFNDEILQFGYVDTFKEYANWLWKADVLPVTSHHEFFGMSVVESAYCGCTPILPNRLSYPEIFSDEPTLFYNSLNDLETKLAQLLECKSSRIDCTEKVKKYDWSYMTPKYDDMFQKISIKS